MSEFERLLDETIYAHERHIAYSSYAEFADARAALIAYHDGVDCLASDLQRLRDLQAVMIAKMDARIAELEQFHDWAVPQLDMKTRQDARIAELEPDAERYRWLCDGHGYFMEEEMLCGHSNDKVTADAAIDAARTAEQPAKSSAENG